MISDCFSFILIVVCYLLLMSTVFTTLFQSDETLNANVDNYASVSMAFRALYDAMIGSYAYSTAPNYQMSNSILTVIHVFISNIFLINFLVAILSTVYQIMQDSGEFSYKANKYEFIEKYSVAMLDTHGYSELVVHPPPINFFTLFILPAMFRPTMMKKASECFSKFIFWMENVFYIIAFVVYEICLCPIIYFKVLITIGFMASILRLIPLVLFWIFAGPFVLMYHVGKDVFYFLKILCDYMDEEDQFKEKEEEDFKQDKIVIYNEVMDVMRSVAHIYRRRMVEAKAKRQILGDMLPKSEFEENQMFLLGEIGNASGGTKDSTKTSLTMEKNLIIEAWARYRPSSKENSPRANVNLLNRQNKRDI